ncbi:VOC family protein [Brevibacterium daeguense]|uniref:VOC family protein n=1 Tax=Brevibacterium daeguense TaxID=909936 RepID=A0ABP8ENC7_9MICO
MYNPSPNGPCWIELSSPDTTAAQEFYGPLFGWDFTEPGPMGFGVKAMIGKAAVAGISPQPEQAPAGQPAFWSVYFRADDLTDLLSRAEDADGQAMMAIPEFDGTAGVALLADPAGTAFGILDYDDDRGFTGAGMPGAPSWFELHTKDFGVRTFYEAVFGWSFETVSDSDDFRYATFMHDGRATGGVLDASRVGIPAHWESYIQVEDTDETARLVRQLGGDWLAQPHDSVHGRVGRFIDAQNGAFTVIQPH